MKKILFVMPTLNSGGAERSLVNLLNEFDYKNYEVDLLIYKRNGKFLDQVPKEVNILPPQYDLSVLYGNKENFSLKYFMLLFYRVFTTIISKIVCYKGKRRDWACYRWEKFYKKKIQNNRNTYDIAISFLECDTTYYVIDKVEALKKYAWIHNDYTSLTNLKRTFDEDEKYFKCYTKVISVSNECVKILQENFRNIDSSKFIYLPNINSNNLIVKKSKEFFPDEYCKDIFTILSIGRLSEQKGFDFAIRTAAIMKSKGINFKWFVIGVGELESKLKKMILKYELQDYFILLGFRSNPYPYIKNCNLFVQTSYHEGKSMVIDEAKILEKTIVLTNYSTAKDQIDNNINGYIMDFDEEKFSDKIIELIENYKRDKKQFIYEKNVHDNVVELEKYYKLLNH